jgi:hypothetical protein
MASGEWYAPRSPFSLLGGYLATLADRHSTPIIISHTYRETDRRAMGFLNE